MNDAAPARFGAEIRSARRRFNGPRSREALGADDAEFPLSDAEFARIARKVHETAGIVLKAHKRQMIYTRLSRRLRALGMRSFSDYLDFIETSAGRGELVEFSNAVTTNLTSFFREAHHFAHLREHVLEPLRRTGRRRVRIWSAGCSSGEEPYSIALAARAARLGDLDLKILATDLDTNMLSRAAEGIYPEARAADIPADLRAGAVQRRHDGAVRIAPAVRSLVDFRRLNLLGDWPSRGPFDAIFCRNVLIYFDAETKATLVKRFAEALGDAGVLYLGHSESLLGEHPLLRSEGRTIYRRRG
jgi:chemotaxis protein methyltransferase CheR